MISSISDNELCRIFGDGTFAMYKILHRSLSRFAVSARPPLIESKSFDVLVQLKVPWTVAVVLLLGFPRRYLAAW